MKTPREDPHSDPAGRPRVAPRLLVADDHAPTRLLLRCLLEPAYGVALAATVDEAVALAAAGPFDLFVLDIRFERARSGVELFRTLRGMRPHTPALALTACALADDRDELLAAGFDAYLSKPFSAADLRDTVRYLLQLARLRSALQPS